MTGNRAHERPSRRNFLRAGVSTAALRLAPRARAADASDGELNATWLRNAIRLSCGWITEIAQLKPDRLGGESNSRSLGHKHWRGALRGEYRPADHKWDFVSPMAHTGQAIKALVMASKALEDEQPLAGARLGAEFIGAERNADRRGKNYGVLYAYEFKAEEVNTAAMLDAVDGLFTLADATGERKYAEWGLDAAFWAARNAYIGDGLMRDAFDVKTGQFVTAPWQSDKPGRPLVDDAVFLKAFRQTRNTICKKIFFAAADRLLKDEDPPGSWNGYPVNARSGIPYSRQAFRWGHPMLAAFQETGERKYLDCARRVGDWYLHATRDEADPFHVSLRPSQALDTSGTASAAILWMDLFQETKDERWMAAARRALRYCLTMQFRDVQDPNLKGALLEQVLPPNGTDRSPYYVRDTATIYFIQAACRFLS